MAMVASGVRLKSNSQAIASHKKVRMVKGSEKIWREISQQRKTGAKSFDLICVWGHFLFQF
jgi:hypothetical protein